MTRRLRSVLPTILLLVVACGGRVPASGAPPAPSELYHPARDLGPLFGAVQLAGVFDDSKTLADAHPQEPPAEVVRLWRQEREDPGFDLVAFVHRHFALPTSPASGFRSDTAVGLAAHIDALWPVLTRTADSAEAWSSRIPLPEPYVVPGGRFREVYYWDSYFTMLGLVESGRLGLVRSMIDDFAWLVRTVGHVPNGSRTYYLSRSQPPFLAAMVGLYAQAADTADALRWLDALEAEHGFWMDGADQVAPGEAYRRVVRLPDGSVLNRYWDDRPEPRPESYREDVRLAATIPEAARPALYRNIRAAAESGNGKPHPAPATPHRFAASSSNDPPGPRPY